MLAANHSGGRLLGRPSIGAMFKSRAAAMYPYIRQQWVESCRRGHEGRTSAISLEPNFSPPSVQAISKASAFLPCNYKKPESLAETRWSRSSHAQPR